MLLAVASGADLPTGIASIFLGSGVLGAVALLGLWFVLTTYRREVARADQALAELRDLNREIREKVIPALTEATRAVTENAQALRDKR